ncbi:MAG: hypothetical protein GY928_26280 [Colwellia sp.]|nr:hypothetical protein [Colwellia sp.]
MQVKDAYEACSKIDNNDFDLVLVDYFHEKKASADDIVNKSIREKKKIVISKISELQKLKEEIRKIQAEVWNCNGKKVAITIKRHILAKNSPTEQIPVALYSRHAKTLMKTHELFPLFEEGIYLAWKPKYFGFTEGDSSEPILKSDFDSENEGELAFLKILFNQVEQEML